MLLSLATVSAWFITPSVAKEDFLVLIAAMTSIAASPASKRKLSEKSLNKKYSVIGSQLEKIQEDEEAIERERDIAEIVEELRNNPSLVRKCKRYVLNGGLFQQGALDTNLFSWSVGVFGNVKYIRKIPLAYLSEFLPTLIPRLSVVGMKTVRKRNGTSLHNILYCVALLRPADPIGLDAKAAWSAAIVERHGKLGSPTSRFTIDDEGEIDWQKSGWYGLDTPEDETDEDTAFQFLVFRVGPPLKVMRSTCAIRSYHVGLARLPPF